MASPRASGLSELPPVFPAIARLRAGVIIALFLLLTLACMPWQALLLRFCPDAARRFPGRYHGWVAKLFGLKLRVIGAPVTGEGVLLLANHTSWLDIVLFSAATPLCFVAKAEIARWPLFGTLARLQRTVFVARDRRHQTGAVAEEIGARLAAGECLLLFPEGTSYDGNRVGPFKSALLGAAEARRADGRHVTVQPVSAAFTGCQGMPMGREMRPFFAWFGDMEMVPHLWEALMAGPLDVTVEFHPPATLDQMSRKELAAQARQQIQAGLSRALAGRA
ncbi:MAG: 1-acyl-sn-glycerol-3-phosphate acyltransferase [Alphaproteobacteria bacterium]|nr:1-acyl-sn-glycerol-3-phosphate acyltransferase [Alphaproteobacteria bacterium]